MLPPTLRPRAQIPRALRSTNPHFGPQLTHHILLRVTTLQNKPTFSTTALQSNKHTTNTTTTTTTSSIQPLLQSLTKKDLNAPSTTFPSPINIPPQSVTSTNTPASSTDKIKRLIATGRAYLTFYKTGLKNVYANYKASIPLRKELGLPTYLPVSPPRSTSATTNTNTSISNNAAESSVLGRAQYQLVRRSARDVRRMIPFTLILLVCGEFTPLIIPVFGAAITPATCRVPSQIEKEREGSSKRKSLALSAHKNASSSSSGSNEVQLLASFATREWVESAKSDEILRASAIFGLVKSHERGWMAGICRGRLRRHIQYLEIDDRMIRDGGVRGLSPVEVRFALEERGLGDVGDVVPVAKREVVEREALMRWLEVRK